MIVLHYTAGTSAESSALFLTRPDVSASAHLVIGRDGEVFQLVPFNIEAWHAGKSWYAGRGGLNRCLLYTSVVDTLPKRIVNGLEIIPVKKLMNGEAFFGILGSLILKSAFSALKINTEEK